MRRPEVAGSTSMGSIAPGGHRCCHQLRMPSSACSRTSPCSGAGAGPPGTSNFSPCGTKCAFSVRPETLLRWYRELVRRKWAVFGRRRESGRPPLSPACRDLILRLAAGNPRSGYQRIHGELLKLGHQVSATAIRSLLRWHGVPPAPRRAGLAWRAFLRAHAGGVLACDCFTVETLRLQTLFVLFFIELQTRRVYVAGCTE